MAQIRTDHRQHDAPPDGQLPRHAQHQELVDREQHVQRPDVGQQHLRDGLLRDLSLQRGRAVDVFEDGRGRRGAQEACGLEQGQVGPAQCAEGLDGAEVDAVDGCDGRQLWWCRACHCCSGSVVWVFSSVICNSNSITWEEREFCFILELSVRVRLEVKSFKSDKQPSTKYSRSFTSNEELSEQAVQ